MSDHAGRGLAAGRCLILAPLAFVSIFCLAPVGWLVITSMRDAGSPLEHYAALLEQKLFLNILGGTFLLAAKVTALCLLIGYPLAYFMTRLSDRWRSVCLFLVIVPYLTSFLVRTYAWIVILADNGIINGALRSLGLIDTPLRLLYDSTAVLIGMVHIMLPIMVLPLFNVMREIDPRLVQAARSLGSSGAQAFARVFLPLSAPGVRSGAILVFVLSLGFYITPLALGRASDVTLAGLIEIQVFQLLDAGSAAASAIVLLILTLLAISAVGGNLAGTALENVGTGHPMTADRSWRRRFFAVDRWRKWILESMPALRFDAMRARLVARNRRIRVGRAPGRRISSRPIIALVAGSVLVFLALPTLVVVPMSFNASDYLSFPPQGYSLRWYRSFFLDAVWLESTWLSVRVAITAALTATVLGTLAAYALFRGDIRFRKAVTAALLSPLIVPAIVLGLALYDVFIRWTLIGSTVGLVLAHAVVAIPYVLVTVSASLARFDPALERASHSLGANPLLTFRRVTLPLIAPGVFSGALFAFIHSFDEVVVTLFAAGWVTRTLPLKMWENIRHQIDPTVAAISTLLLMVLLLSLLVQQLRARIGAAHVRA